VPTPERKAENGLVFCDVLVDTMYMKRCAASTTAVYEYTVDTRDTCDFNLTIVSPTTMCVRQLYTIG